MKAASRARHLVAVAVVVGSSALAAGAGISGARPAATGVPPLMTCGGTTVITLQVRNPGPGTWPATTQLTLHASPEARALGSPAAVPRTGSGAIRRSATASFTVRLSASAGPTLVRPSWRLYRGQTFTRLTVGGPVQVYCDPGSGVEKIVLAGYQGWFSCPDDGAPPGSWIALVRRQHSTRRTRRSTSGPTRPS